MLHFYRNTSKNIISNVKIISKTVEVDAHGCLSIQVANKNHQITEGHANISDLGGQNLSRIFRYFGENSWAWK